MALPANNGDKNLTSAVEVFTGTATHDCDVMLEFRIGDGTKNLNAGVGTLTFKVTNNNNVERWTYYKDTDTRVEQLSRQYHVESGNTISATLESSNSNDTDVDVTVTPRAVPSVQNIAAMLFGADGATIFVATNGNASNLGTSPDMPKLSPKTVIEAASTYDTVVLSAGVFALGDNKISVPDDVSVFGAGKKRTIITSTAGSTSKGCLVNPGDRSRLKGFTIRGLLDNGTHQYPLGGVIAGGVDTAFEDAVAEDLSLEAQTDGLYMGLTSVCSIELINSDISSELDTIVIAHANASAVLKRSRLIVRNTASGACSGVSITSGAITLVDCALDIENTFSGSTVKGIYAYGGTVHMYGGSIRTYSLLGDDNSVDIDAGGSGTVILDSAAFDYEKLSGSPTIINNTADVLRIGGGAQSATDLKDLVDTGYDPSTHKIAGVVLVDTTTTNTDMIDAAGVRSAVGLASANLDTQLSTINGVADAVLVDTGTTLPASMAGITGALGGEGSYTGTLTIDDGAGTGLEGAVVHAYRGGVLKASGTTDSSGEITNWVFGAYTYNLAVRLASYQPETDTITVSGDAWSKTISMTAISITAPSDATLCTVQFRVKLSATAVEGAVCKAKLLGTNQAADGTILSNAESSDTTDSEGVAELQLVQKGSIVKGDGRYKIWTEIAGNTIASVETIIPNQSTILFEDLL